MTSKDNSLHIDPSRRIHVIIDVLNDFISGSMACLHAKEAISKITERINTHPYEEVRYVCDAHPQQHSSFLEMGGQWPVHCVKHSFGQQIDLTFYTCINQPTSRPRISENVFEKGSHPEYEEYSGFNAVGTQGKTLNETLFRGQPVLVSGIATEFCVLETVKDLLQNGFQVEVLQDGLAYVTLEGHKQALAQMRELGVKIM